MEIYVFFFSIVSNEIKYRSSFSQENKLTVKNRIMVMMFNYKIYMILSVNWWCFIVQYYKYYNYIIYINYD